MCDTTAMPRMMTMSKRYDYIVDCGPILNIRFVELELTTTRPVIQKQFTQV